MVHRKAQHSHAVAQFLARSYAAPARTVEHLEIKGIASHDGHLVPIGRQTP
jgi:hypothetical protein